MSTTINQTTAITCFRCERLRRPACVPRKTIVPAGDFSPGLKFEPTALVVAEDLPFARWQSALKTLVPIQQSSSWWVGDLLVFGGKRYGETYDEALKATGFRLQTLKNTAWVSRRVPAEVRRADLTWSAHRAVASLAEDEQIEWLDRAAANDWTSEELTRELRKATRPTGDDTGDGDGDGDDFPDPERKRRCECPSCGYVWEESC